MALPQPNPDASGGFLTIGYTDGLDEHFIRVHVAPFVTTSIPSAPNYNWPYASAHGSETGVRDTAVAFIESIKVGYDSTWQFFVQGLHQIVGGLAVPILPVPFVGTEAGNASPTQAAVAAYDPARFCATTLTMATTAGGRYRLMLVAFGSHADPGNANVLTTGRLLQTPAGVTYGSGGISAVDQTVVSYVSAHAAANGLRAHDGTQPIGVGKVQVCDRKRLRRKYGFS